MADDLLQVLTRFHREVVLPDLERVVDARLDARISPLREEMLANFDAIGRKLDRLVIDYQSVNAAVTRIEERLDGVEQKLDGMVVCSQLLA